MSKLNERQKALLETRLKDLEDKPCPVCGAVGEWKMLDNQYQLLSFGVKEDHSLTRPETYNPTGVIYCDHCDHFLLFGISI